MRERMHHSVRPITLQPNARFLHDYQRSTLPFQLCIPPLCLKFAVPLATVRVLI